ncbi:hypothetical protein [Sporolactobacillus vineae]|uniref:hypothetical protein n=1 Tax=Sporolactobacillus vineae TaxID=444463 RepID=UPI000288D84F|nr:hypothetical protein [Sporolactobacillus vineae]
MDVFTFQASTVRKDILYKDGDQVIIHLTLQAGQAIPEHSGNDAIVTVIPIRGEIAFSTQDQTATLVPGKLARLNARERHSLRAAKDSEAILVKWNNR